ncbi:uncharacterized protein TNCV_2895141 [Trichonephila clavipes]|nr:uncharacterized protein TNCV_2895141 [Trichonephila clavipes]
MGLLSVLVILNRENTVDESNGTPNHKARGPGHRKFFSGPGLQRVLRRPYLGHMAAAVAEWYRYRTMACFVTGSSPVPLKTRRVGQRCTLNLSRAETSSRWCGVVVRRGGASSGVVHVT